MESVIDDGIWKPFTYLGMRFQYCLEANAWSSTFTRSTGCKYFVLKLLIKSVYRMHSYSLLYVRYKEQLYVYIRCTGMTTNHRVWFRIQLSDCSADQKVVCLVRPYMPETSKSDFLLIWSPRKNHLKNRSLATWWMLCLGYNIGNRRKYW